MFSYMLVIVALVTAVSANDLQCPEDGQFFYAHPTRCSLFIECNKGIQITHECFGDFVFNPATNFCDFPANVECEDVIETEPPTEPPTEAPPTEAPPTEAPPTEAPPTKAPPTTGPVGECPALNGEYVDFLTDAGDCTVFYMCNWGTPIKMDCPAGLYFNPTLNVCDWPQDAGCTVSN